MRGITVTGLAGSFAACRFCGCLTEGGRAVCPRCGKDPDMWTCEHCGTQQIAADLTMCPHCMKERKMPKIAVGAEPSDASGPETSQPYGDVLPPPEAPSGPPAANAPKADWVDHAVSQGADPDAAAAMTKARLIEEHGNG